MEKTLFDKCPVCGQEPKWWKWISEKTKKEIEERAKEMEKYLESPEEGKKAFVMLAMILEYSRKFRPDLSEEIFILFREAATVLDSVILTEAEKERRGEELNERFGSIFIQIEDAAEMMERPVS